MLNQASFAVLFVVTLATIATVPTGGNGAVVANKTVNSSHNLIVGTRLPYDRLLSQQVSIFPNQFASFVIWGGFFIDESLIPSQIVTKSSSWLQIVTQEVNFRTPNYETITQVRALDQKTNGNGAYASITAGGPGNRNTTIRFKSQRGHGISFILEIYGRWFPVGNETNQLFHSINYSDTAKLCPVTDSYVVVVFFLINERLQWKLPIYYNSDIPIYLANLLQSTQRFSPSSFYSRPVGLFHIYFAAIKS